MHGGILRASPNETLGKSFGDGLKNQGPIGEWPGRLVGRHKVQAGQGPKWTDAVRLKCSSGAQ
jgi:hypothetical protein